MPNKRIALLAGIAVAVAGAALAQDRPDSLLPPGFDDPPPPPPPPQPRVPEPTPAPATVPVVEDDDDEETADVAVAQVERDDDEDGDAATEIGTAPAVTSTGAIAFAQDPFANAIGEWAQPFMRDMDAPLLSRWAHIGLRHALLASQATPQGFDTRDWIAERIWLLLRMGEADAARLLLATVPRRSYNARMSQMALQVALATSDMGTLCPVPSSLDDAEPVAEPLVDAICEALIGQGELAVETIRRERRGDRIGGIDLTLAEKLVGAGSGTGRATTIEWDATQRLTAWRYGMATSTGLSLPENLLDGAQPQLRAWHARASLLDPAERLDSARIAAGMGVFSGQAMTDFHSLIYAGVDANERGSLDAWQLRLAHTAASNADRIAAMRRLWAAAGDDPLAVMGARATTARAAARIMPSASLSGDGAALVSSMITGGFEDAIGAWVPVLTQIDEDDGDALWGLLSLAVIDARSLDLREDRVRDFIRRDESEGQIRSKMLVAGLAGLERISPALLAELDGDYDMGIARTSAMTNALELAAQRGDAGSALLASAFAMQGSDMRHLPPRYVYHAVRALRATGQTFLARMVAAEALSRA